MFKNPLWNKWISNLANSFDRYVWKFKSVLPAQGKICEYYLGLKRNFSDKMNLLESLWVHFYIYYLSREFTHAIILRLRKLGNIETDKKLSHQAFYVGGWP